MRTLVHQIITLIIKDIKLELQQKYALNSILLYILATLFLCSLVFDGIITKPVWNALFWVILLFSSVNAISNGLTQENSTRNAYYYSITSAQAYVVSKMIYNSFLMIILSLLTLIVYGIFLGNFIVNYGLFLSAIGLGVFGFSSLFTLISAIASKTNNNFSLVAVLGFPVVLPLHLLVSRISKIALAEVHDPELLKDLVSLVSIDGIIFLLSIILFPYIWRD